MPGKKANTDDATNKVDSSTSVPSELDTLRHIVFGEAQAGIDERIAQLETSMQNSFERA